MWASSRAIADSGQDSPTAARAALLPLGFAGWCFEATATRAHRLAELLAFRWRHFFPALFYSSPNLGARTAMSTKTPEENAAKRQQSESLPESDLPPSEQRRQ